MHDGIALTGTLFQQNTVHSICTHQRVRHLVRPDPNPNLTLTLSLASNCTNIEDLFDDILQDSATIESMDDKSEKVSLSQG